ncbi:Neprilysin-1 [Aphelenchoides fujianensis]|nr:Neprilysin-1 [Aphelenchoides fujianensis]
MNRPLFLLLFLLPVWATRSSECRDLVRECARAAALCGDRWLGATVRRNCPRTCGKCPHFARSSPIDHVMCKKWTRNSFCTAAEYPHAQRAVLCPHACRPFLQKKEKKPVKKKKEVPYGVFRERLNETADPCASFFDFACGAYAARHPSRRPTGNFDANLDLMPKIHEQQMNETVHFGQAEQIEGRRENAGLSGRVPPCGQNREPADKRSKIGGGFPLLTAGWTAARFEWTAALVGFQAASGESALFHVDATKTPSGEMRVVVAPANPLLQHPEMHERPEFAPQIRALRNFLVELVGFVAADRNSTVGFDAIATAVDEVLQLEREVGRVLNDRPPGNPMDRTAEIRFSELQREIKNIDWKRLVAESPLIPAEIRPHFAADPPLVLLTPEWIRGLNGVFERADARTLANYLHIQLLMKQVGLLDGRFSSAGRRLADMLDAAGAPTSRRSDGGRAAACFELVAAEFPLVNDHLYVLAHVHKRTLREVDGMLESLRSALHATIRRKTWMDARTRTAALRKLRRVRTTVGAVEDARDERRLDARYVHFSLDPAASFRQQAVALKQARARERMLALQHPERFAVAEQLRSTTVNALYSPLENAIFVSAAILQPPFFDARLPPAVNFGAIGHILGHEFTHAFDPQGADFDADGRRANWWDGRTRREFDRRARCFERRYGRLVEPRSGLRVDGRRTLAENVADNGGLRAAFAAFRRHQQRQKHGGHVPGYAKYTPDQTFFLSFAAGACSSFSAAFSRRLVETDVHSPNRFRVDAVLQNSAEFARAFQCPRGSRMNPVSKCVVW